MFNHILVYILCSSTGAVVYMCKGIYNLPMLIRAKINNKDYDNIYDAM